MARVSLSALISHIRLLISDPAGATETFIDDELVTFADARRIDVLYQPLTPLPSIAPGGAVSHLTWVAAGGGWESDSVLVDATYNVLTPATSDWMAGRWTFATTQQSVIIRGARYDLYAAAGDAVDAWIAKIALVYDFGVDGGNYKRSQMRQGLEALRSRLRAQSSTGGVTTATMYRSDSL